MADPALSPAKVSGAGLCIGCGGCAAREGASLVWDEYGQRKPPAGEGWTKAPQPGFDAICPFSPSAADENAIAEARFPQAPEADPLIGRFEQAYVGHVGEGEFRMAGSSGGMVSWAAAELMRTGKIDAVAHVIPTDPEAENRFFRYRLSRSVGEIGEGARSRYYPSDMAEVLAQIRATPGRYAVVGVPCFIKAVHLLRAQDPVLNERITHTLGLFCGHMKSARLVDSFAWQLDAPPEQVHAVEYRRKDASRPANWYTAHLTLKDRSARWQDWWHLADGDWGAGFFQNSACNYCDDVVAETADIAFGDAWVEPYSSDGRGTNVAIVRSPEILALVEAARAEGRLDLKPVDAAFIVETQAAGLRHRREGLSYRLRFAPPKLPLRKRVQPGGQDLPWRRKRVYRTRFAIARWSHRVAWLALRFELPGLYTRWAKASLRVYEGFAYLRGPIGKLVSRLEKRDTPER